MNFSFAAIPTPVLIAVPVVGLVAAVVFYEIEKNKKAKAAAAAAAAAALQQPIIAAPPAGATGPVTASSTAAAASHTPVLGIKKGGTTTWLTPGGPVVQTTPPVFSLASPIAFKLPTAAASNPATTGFGPQIVTAAQQAYAAIGPQPSQASDFTNNLNWQVVAATLSQLQNNPTTAQLGTALTNLQQNGSAYATSAYNILNRVNQVIAA
jgi:hypothetical protein